MKKTAVGLALCTYLIACGGEPPFPVEDDTEIDVGAGEGIDDEEISGDRTLPPGTETPAADDSITRREPSSEDDATDGNGFARNVSYDAENDTFTVDNLPFDGGDDAPYNRSTFTVENPTTGAPEQIAASLGPFAVYEAPAQFPDADTGELINQFTHRAIYGVSDSGNTQFAIVRTGAYVQYGFGGFVYQRNGSVTLPQSGQAVFNGQAAGVRDFDGSGGSELSTADVRLAVDFSDFNEATGRYPGAFGANITNRRVFDLDGRDITNDVVARINNENDSSLTAIPTATFVIAPNVLDANGEATGEIRSAFLDDNGNTVAYETGNYYAVVAGENADEIVGVVVAENSADPRAENVRDTMGFIVYRPVPEE